jgi:hypothetical protein
VYVVDPAAGKTARVASVPLDARNLAWDGQLLWLDDERPAAESAPSDAQQ